MSRIVHRLAVIQPADSDAVMSVNQFAKIGQSDFDDLACGKCGFILLANTSPFDAVSIVGRGGNRILVACPKCGDANQLSDGRGKNRT